VARNILIMGPPGSGKGTQAARIAERRDLAHISTGDMLRAAMAAGSELGKRVKDIVDRGDLVPDDLMLELVLDRLGQPDAAGGFLLDGFPRTVAQAEALHAALDGDRTLELIVLLEVPEDVLVDRALARGRVDDTEETIRHRQRVYRDSTRPVLEALEGKVERVDVDGVGEIDEITRRIEAALDAR
jgi:adenylate kinase